MPQARFKSTRLIAVTVMILSAGCVKASRPSVATTRTTGRSQQRWRPIRAWEVATRVEPFLLYSFLSAALTPSDPYCTRWALEACQNSSSLARSYWSYSAGNIYRAWHVRLVLRFATSRRRAEMETDAS